MPELNKMLRLARAGRRRARWCWKAAPLIAAAVMACEPRTPDRWIGLDRALASCAYDDGWLRATCVGDERVYTCVRDWGERVWRCAEQRSPEPATAEAGR